MPPESFRYIPLRCLDNLMLEIRISEFAFFSSGYKDYDTPYGSVTGIFTSDNLGPLKDIATVGVVKRNKFKINRMIIEADVIEF